MRVFLGSSSQGIEDLDLVTSMIEEADMDARRWTAPGTFFVNGGTWDALIKMTREVEAAAFVFRPDDKTTRAKQSFASTRDNVILEFGLFSGALGPTRCAIFRRGDAWIPSDLKGITYISLEDGRAQDEVRHWADRMREELEVPDDLSPKQIASIARAMKKSNMPMSLAYAKFRKLGIPEELVNYALEEN